MLETNVGSKGNKNFMPENAPVYFPCMQESLRSHEFRVWNNIRDRGREANICSVLTFFLKHLICGYF